MPLAWSHIITSSRTSRDWLDVSRSLMATSKSTTIDLQALYAKPLPSKRTGPLYNAFSYPTKISPEAIAVFIASHTEPGATVLDSFAGSGTTGVAALLCDKPTAEMEAMASELGVVPKWGPRNAVLYEIGTLGSFVGSTLCSPPSPERFTFAVAELCNQARALTDWMYSAVSPDGVPGAIRHMIWSEVIRCPQCQFETTYWEAAVRRDPLRLDRTYACAACSSVQVIENCARVTESVWDELLGKHVERRKRALAFVYGVSGKVKWQRPPTTADKELCARVEATPLPDDAPLRELIWGDLYRAGYHLGITHLHQFYTRRNFFVMATMWRLACAFPADVRDALRLLVLSYNSSHSTMMTRVVVKGGAGDLVLTGAQSGVLYISGLPVEKNIILGVERKAKSFRDAFALLSGSCSTVRLVNASSERLCLPDASVDYVFTDPPFGDYIPYAEINQINELWMDAVTNRTREIIVSKAQGKNVEHYRQMMGNVFSEISRVLRPHAKATVVFHSAKASVWRALCDAYGSAGLRIEASSVLDKIQTSFKQTVADVTVKGDPLLLLSKGEAVPSELDSMHVAESVIASAQELSAEERLPTRLYSRFVARCLELGVAVRIDAREFYEKARVTEAKP